MAGAELQERPLARRMVRREKRVEVSASIQDAWMGLRVAISAAAMPFTRLDRFPVSPFSAAMLPSADAALDRALRAEPRTDVAGRFDQDAEGRLSIIVSWIEAKG